MNVLFRDNASFDPCGHVITRRCSGEYVDCTGAVEDQKAIPALNLLGALATPAAKFVSCAQLIFSSVLINIDCWNHGSQKQLWRGAFRDRTAFTTGLSLHANSNAQCSPRMSSRHQGTHRYEALFT